MRRDVVTRGAAVAVLLGAIVGGAAWTRLRDTPASAPGTVTLDVNPRGVAVDTLAGRVFVANTGINGSGQTVSVLDSRSGRLVQTVTVGRGPSDVAVDERTGRLFVANGGYYDGAGSHAGSIVVLDTRTGRVLRRTATAGNPFFVTVDALTGRAVVTVYNTSTPGAATVYELDARDGRMIRKTTRYRALLASDHGTAHAFVATGKDVRMDDARDGHTLGTILRGVDPLSGPGSAAVDEQTGRLFVADYARGRVSVVDTRSGVLLGVTTVGPHPFRLSVDPRTARVFVVNRGPISAADRPSGAGSVSMLDARTGAVLRTVPLDLDAVAVTLDERRGLVLVSTAGPSGPPDNGPLRRGKVFVLDAHSGVIRRILPVGVGPYAIAEDARTGHAFIVNSIGDGGSYNGPSAWYLQWLPHHPPRGTVTMLDLSR